MSKTKPSEQKGAAVAGAPNGKEIAASQPTTVSQSFVNSVTKHFKAEMGDMIQWSAYQQMLAQHLYIKIDSAMKELQAKGKAVNWQNVNMVKLAMDAVHIVNLGLDGLIKNHVHVVPYKNGALSAQRGTPVYDLALRPGYTGHLYSRVRASAKPIVKTVVQLVFEGDMFVPSFSPGGDSYVYTPKDVFREDEAVVGGFGFIVYEDPRLNKLVPVTMRDLARSRNASKARGTAVKDEETGEVTTSGNFWKDSYVEMCEKTVAHRTGDAIEIDPAVLNSASIDWAREQDALEAEADMDRMEAEEANGQTVGFASDAPTEGVTSSTPESEDNGHEAVTTEAKPF